MRKLQNTVPAVVSSTCLEQGVPRSPRRLMLSGVSGAIQIGTMSKVDYLIALISFIVCFGPVRTGVLVCLCQFEFFPTPSGISRELPASWNVWVDLWRWLTAGDKSSQLPEGSEFFCQHLSRTSLGQTLPIAETRVSLTEVEVISASAGVDAGRHMTWWWRTVCEKMLCVSELPWCALISSWGSLCGC